MQKPKRTRKNVSPPDLHPDPILDPFSRHYAYVVAQYAWSDGLAANAIARKLGLEPTPRNLMQVKRALKRGQQFLTLKPPEEFALAGELDKKVNKGALRRTRFVVVQDVIEAGRETMFGVVSARAAELVVKIVSDLASRPASADAELPDIVVGNAGGRTIAEMCRALRRSPPLIGQTDEAASQFARRAVVIAGNAGYLPRLFDRSANYLSVTLADLLGAGHMALPAVTDDEFLAEYRGLVDRMSLFICGVGTAKEGLARRHFKDQTIPFPAAAVGDIAFHLVDRKGGALTLPYQAQKFMAEVNPALSLDALRRTAIDNRVLLILDGEKPLEKLEVSIAALRGKYATDVVLGSRLAKAILAEY